MDTLFTWIEATSFSTWLRESPSLWVFPFVLILHTVGLAFFVGANVAWDVRVLGFSAGIPLDVLRRYFIVMWAGFWVNAFSGVLLLIAYPTKALTNPLFYVKLGLIAAALLGLRWMRRNVFGSVLPENAKRVALMSVIAWAGAIFAGRWLAYTYIRLMTT